MIISLSAEELVLRVVRGTKGASEIPQATNRGPFVELCQAAGKGKPGDPWCADLVARVGQVALPGLWPLPATGSCAELAHFAKEKGILFDTPETGDVFVVWHPELTPVARFGHAGFVLDATTKNTLSGNTSGEGSREGWLVWERVWPFKPADKFIRWRLLLEGAR